ncbi:MAG: hypothetical protein JZU63_10270, partial [Rhodoferax sp.]|nr:hypothetical protein [Rhodoferax sp.]
RVKNNCGAMDTFLEFQWVFKPAPSSLAPRYSLSSDRYRFGAPRWPSWRHLEATRKNKFVGQGC